LIYIVIRDRSMYITMIGKESDHFDLKR
jgi:hypothetical protein